MSPPAAAGGGGAAPAAAIGDRNRAFWDELCATGFARSLGITDSSPESLRRYDDWFFGFYPYLEEEIPFGGVEGTSVLEVGLGYGSVSGRLMQSGATLTGLDIASGPCAMVRLRAAQLASGGIAVQGSILDAPFDDASFDLVVAIGSYHHTGDTMRALDETYRILRPGGRAVVMVYNAYSYRRWLRETVATTRCFASDKLGFGSAGRSSERERARYDRNSTGQAAPHTDFVSVGGMRRMTQRWSRLTFRRRNVAAEWPFSRVERDVALRRFGRWLGLDIYFQLEK